jgi:hypothetical protein
VGVSGQSLRVLCSSFVFFLPDRGYLYHEARRTHEGGAKWGEEKEAVDDGITMVLNRDHVWRIERIES